MFKMLLVLVVMGAILGCAPCASPADVRACISSVLSLPASPATGIAGAVEFCGRWRESNATCRPDPVVTDAGALGPLPPDGGAGDAP